jgi:hypothetical protein
VIVRFVLVEEAGIAVGRVEVERTDGSSVHGIGVDLVMLARNDPGALSYPSGASTQGLTAVLLPHLRMLTRGRTVPLEAELRL